MPGLILQAAVCLGVMLSGAGPFNWQIVYSDGVVEFYSDGYRLCFNPRPGRSFTYNACDPISGSCDAIRGPYLADPLPGDCTFDGAVGAADFNLVKSHWGETAP